MKTKNYKVYFAHTAVGSDGVPLAGPLIDHDEQFQGSWPVQELEGYGYQLRDLSRRAHVWTGVFGRLRDDAPHVIDADSNESELALDPGDRLIEKCHFMYRERHNVLLWQVNRSAAALGRFEQYLYRAMGAAVMFPLIQQSDRLEEVLAGEVYEMSFGFSRPETIEDGAPRWTQSAMQLVNDVAAAKAKFQITAPRHGSLSRTAKRWLQQMTREPGVQKIKVRLTDETDLIDIVTTPLKEGIQVDLHGMYPLPAEVFEQLELAYDRQRSRIAQHRGEQP